MDLYTSLTRLKQAMNNGQLPPMTPLTEQAKKVIDPELTIAGGAGGIVADEERGLRCPIRGCGAWKHDLGRHVAMAHPTIGVAAFREAMSIPKSAPLMSETFRERKRRLMRGRLNDALKQQQRRGRKERRGVVARRAKGKGATAATMGSRNLRDRCIAQLSHKLIDLANTLGRSPSSTEARNVLGQTLVYHIIQTFGTWNAAKAHCGLEAFAPRNTARTKENRERALDTLGAWVAEHDGELPSYHDAMYGNATPLLLAPSIYYAVFGSQDWDECMRRAAALLAVIGGKYGLPEKRAVAS